MLTSFLYALTCQSMTVSSQVSSQFFFTPVYSSTVEVLMVVTGLPDLSGATLYVAVVL